MYFALDTYRTFRTGSRDAKIRQLFALAVWFLIGTYIGSALVDTFSQMDGAMGTIGGMIATVAAFFIKFGGH